MVVLNARFKQQGFTLIELIITTVLLGIMAIATSEYLRSGSLIYRDTANVQVLVGESRFVLERMKRELYNSLPNSALSHDNSAGEANYCLSFVPVESSSTYIDLAVQPLLSSQAEVVSASNQPVIAAAGEYWLANYVLNNREVLEPAGSADRWQLRDVNCSETSGKVFCIQDISTDDTSHTSTLNFTQPVSFAADSPSQRFFIVAPPIKYCLNSGRLYRYQPASNINGVLMAQHLSAASGQTPFQVLAPSLSRNGLVNVQLQFTIEQQFIDFNYDMVVPNQP